MVNLPEGNHEAVLLGPHKDMVEQWSGVAVELDAEILLTHGKHFSIGDVVPTLAYAHVAKAAYALSSTAAHVAGGDFDPEMFGKRCAEIAREQMDRYLTHCEEHAGESEDEAAVAVAVADFAVADEK